MISDYRRIAGKYTINASKTRQRLWWQLCGGWKAHGILSRNIMICNDDLLTMSFTPDACTQSDYQLSPANLMTRCQDHLFRNAYTVLMDKIKNLPMPIRVC